MIKIPAKQISYSSVKRDKKSIKYIVIHYTAGDGDTAVAEGKYFANGNNRQAGAHFFVDRGGNVVKSIDMNRTAWAVGGKKYTDCAKTGGGKYYGRCTNANSVSIELCDILKKKPTKKQIEAVKETVKYIQKYCPNAKTIIRHFDVNGKHCPATMMDGAVWKAFKEKIC